MLSICNRCQFKVASKTRMCTVCGSTDIISAEVAKADTLSKSTRVELGYMMNELTQTSKTKFESFKNECELVKEKCVSACRKLAALATNKPAYLEPDTVASVDESPTFQPNRAAIVSDSAVHRNNIVSTISFGPSDKHDVPLASRFGNVVYEEKDFSDSIPAAEEKVEPAGPRDFKKPKPGGILAKRRLAKLREWYQNDNRVA